MITNGYFASTVPKHLGSVDQKVSSSQGEQFIYATFLASEHYLPALEVFLYTFVQSHAHYPLAICLPKLPSQYSSLLSSVQAILQKYSSSSLQYHLVVWPLILPPTHGHERLRWSINWTKLQLWSMTTYDKILYLDLDTILLRNIDHVFTQYPFPAESRGFLGTYDWGRWIPFGQQKVNGGVFLLQPNHTEYIRLLKARHAVTTYPATEAEQGLLNRYFLHDRLYTKQNMDLNTFLNTSYPANKRNEWNITSSCCLPVYYNMQKTVKKYIPGIWDMERMQVLHYTGEKPWSSWSTTEFRLWYVKQSEKEERISNDAWDEEEYIDLHMLWKGLYFEARKEELSMITIYQSYHTQACWQSLYTNTTSMVMKTIPTLYKYVRLAGPKYQKEDIDASELIPLLRSTEAQIALGEFGSMLAIASLPYDTLPAYVGFTSWKERIKANWKEGASIDWTKIRFPTNDLSSMKQDPNPVNKPVIYYWYSLYTRNKNFYEAIEDHHPGMMNVLKELITFPLPDMPSNIRYIYGNYFISSKDIFLAYMKDASELMHRFWTKYPLSSSDGKKNSSMESVRRGGTRGECPFGLPMDTIDPGKRCIGYLLERYLNIWMMSRKVGFIYAVDNPHWRES
jgi:alpha-N-acetylglucosamine transferase